MVLVILAQYPFIIFGQEQTKKPHAREQQLVGTGSGMNVHQILDHARRLSEEARGLEPKEDEIRMQAGLADSVWTLDQSLGKQLLLRSFDLAVASLGEQPGLTTPRQTTIDPTLLFLQISSIAARHDPRLEKQLSERWQTNIASSPRKQGQSKTNAAQLSSLLLSESSRYLTDSWQKARQLFRESVSLRVLPDHCYFLMNRRTHNAVITDKLFADTLDILAQRPITEANELLVLSSYLFSPDNSIAYVAISGYNTANAAGNISAVPQNTALAKQYLDLLLAKLNPSESLPSDVVYFALKNLLPQYAALAPDHLHDLYAKLGTLGTNVASSNTKAAESANNDFTASEAATIAAWQKRVQMADTIEDAGRRDLEYFTIILSYLLPNKDFAHALRLAARIYSDELRQTLTDLVNLRSIQSRLKRSEIVLSASGGHWTNICAAIKDPLLKVIALSSIAEAHLNEQSKGDAILLLDQAGKEAWRISNDQDRLQVQLMLAQLYLNADTVRGFGAAAATFKGINQLPDFNFRRSNVVVNATVQGMTNQLPIELPTSPSLTSTVGKMCRVNCTEALETCRMLERKNVRLWAIFEAVRTAILDSEEVQKTVFNVQPRVM